MSPDVLQKNNLVWIGPVSSVSEDHVDESYGYPSFYWVAVIWLLDRVPGQ